MTTYAGFAAWLFTTVPGLIFLLFFLSVIPAIARPPRSAQLGPRARGGMLIVAGLVLFAVAVH